MVYGMLKDYHHELYVNVGAYHPFQNSTTIKFYMNSWRGINLEPSQRRIQNFFFLTPKDINLKNAISS